MGFEISGIKDERMKSWATKCDANGDGKISDEEINIFEQGKKTMHKMGDANRDRVIVGGVALFVDDLKTIRTASYKPTPNHEVIDFMDYAVEFNTGVKARFSKQDENNEAGINSSKIHLNYIDFNKGITDTHTNAFNFTNGHGISIQGTHYADRIEVRNSKIDYIDAKGSSDYTSVDGCVGSKNHIISDCGEATNSSGLKIKRDSVPRLRPDKWYNEKEVNQENPNLTW